jgi:hypothetical protein
VTDPKTGGPTGIVLAVLAIGSLVAAVAASAVFCRREAPRPSAAAAAATFGGVPESERQALSTALEFGASSDARFAYDALAPQGGGDRR